MIGIAFILKKKKEKGLVHVASPHKSLGIVMGNAYFWVLGSILGNWKGFSTLSGRFFFIRTQ